MFGFVVADVERLSEELQKEYRACYCGICCSIRKRYGQLSGLALSYDFTLIPLLLYDIYGREDSREQLRCPVHPHRPREVQTGIFTDYAADMNLLLMYYKLLDDWNDEKSIVRYGAAQLLKEKVAVLQGRYPRQYRAIADSLEQIAAIERTGDPNPDAAAHWFGVLLGELMWLEPDTYTENLQKFGYYLGRAIYYMDAELDLRRDLQHQRYNPFTFVSAENRIQCIRDMLGQATEIYRKLPVSRNAALIENVLYCGIWKKYALKNKGESHNGKRPLSDTGCSAKCKRGRD